MTQPTDPGPAAAWLLWALPALPAVSGLLVGTLGYRLGRRAAGVALAVMVATGVVGGWAIATRPAVEAAWIGPLSAGLAVDGLSAVMIGVVVVVATAVVAFARVDIDEGQPRFYALMLLFVAAMLGTVTASSLAFLLLFWEVMSACSWGLIGFWWYEPDRPPCANTAFLVTRGADTGLYLATAAVFAGAGTVTIAAVGSSLEGAWLHLAAAGLVLAAAGKSAQLPFSSWLAAAMQGPTPVSALLHSATMVAAGAYLVMRLHPLLDAAGWALPAVAWLGAVSALLLSGFALAQRDIKQLLAASTVAQVGFMFVAAGTGGIPASAAHLTAHAAFKSLLFMGAGVLLHRLGTRSLDELRDVGRDVLGRTRWAFAAAALALAALPPLSGWVTKDHILAAAKHHELAIWALAIVTSLVTALYAGRLLAVVLLPSGAGTTAGHLDTSEPVTSGYRLPMWVLGAATVGFAAVGLPPVWEGWSQLTGGPRSPTPKAWELVLSSGVAAVGIGVAGWWRRTGRLAPWRPVTVPAPVRRALYWWLWLDDVGFRGVVLPVRRLADRLARFDQQVVDAGVEVAGRTGVRLAGFVDHFDRRRVHRLPGGAAHRAAASARVAGWFDVAVVDRVVEALTAGTVRSAGGSRRTDERLVDRLVEAIAAAVGVLGRWATRPQTGLSHQYYTQAIAAVFVLVVVFLAIGALT
jgi:NADH-quinone oxidoreductase subunit L